MTIRASIDQYISFLKASGKTDCTVTSYTATLDRMETFLLNAGRESIGDVTSADLVAFKVSNSSQVSATTLRLFCTHLNCFFDFLADMEIIDKNPYKKGLMVVEKSAIREQQSKTYEVLTIDDVITIANGYPHLMHEKNRLRNRALLLTFLTTGLRNESVREMKVSDVDFENGRIKVTSAKGGKTGYAPMNTITAKAIREYLESDVPASDDSPLFRTTGKAIGRTHMSCIVEVAVREFTGKEGFRSHAMRHTFASLLSNNGMSDGEISLLLFHSDSTGASVTSRYIERDYDKLFAKVNEIFTSLLERAA